MAYMFFKNKQHNNHEREHMVFFCSVSDVNEISLYYVLQARKFGDPERFLHHIILLDYFPFGRRFLSSPPLKKK